MNIKRNEKYKKQLVELHNLKEKYSSDYKNISEAYWPVYDQIKKQIKDKIYLIGISTILVVLVLFSLIFGGLKNEYLIGGCLGISLGLLAWTTIKYLKFKPTIKEFNKEFKEKNDELEKLQTAIRILHDDMVEEMMMIMCYNTYHHEDEKVDLNEWDKNYSEVREKIINETDGSLAYEDVVAIYNRWVEEF